VKGSDEAEEYAAGGVGGAASTKGRPVKGSDRLGRPPPTSVTEPQRRAAR